MAEYKVEIIESSREFTARERIKIKNYKTSGKLINDMSNESRDIIEPDSWATLHVQDGYNVNEDNSPKEYDIFVLFGKNGDSYYTGSDSFIKAFKEIWTEMGDEEYSVYPVFMPSKNYKGNFITCEIL